MVGEFFVVRRWTRESKILVEWVWEPLHAGKHTCYRLRIYPNMESEDGTLESLFNVGICSTLPPVYSESGPYLEVGTGGKIMIKGLECLSPRQGAETCELLLRHASIYNEDTLRRRIGRRPKAALDPMTIPAWSLHYDEDKAALARVLDKRDIEQLGRYDADGRVNIIRKAFPSLRKREAEALGEYRSISAVALRHTAWECSGIEIGTWGATRLREILKKSDRIYNIQRKGNRRNEK